MRAHQVYNAKEISKLSSHEEVKGALGLSDKQTSVDGTDAVINYVNESKKQKAMYNLELFFMTMK
ncbi:hypothetical protein HUG15_18575 [Salicibibacter cibarius]|uniref:Uncharacterized protein n=1 Tax=Salicibibacter cibarius TaxID=2743000 RepID=A0A7T7CCX7_9BACI|nr:hypothetical protein HUG15_18575 [Salicibibacter cibarius]